MCSNLRSCFFLIAVERFSFECVLCPAKQNFIGASLDAVFEFVEAGCWGAREEGEAFVGEFVARDESL